MTYSRDLSTFTRLALNALRSVSGAKVYPGIAAYELNSAGALAEQIQRARAIGAPGFGVFAYASFFPSPSHESKPGASAKRLRSELRKVLERNITRPPQPLVGQRPERRTGRAPPAG